MTSTSASALAEEAAVTEPPSVTLSERRAAEAFQAYARKEYAEAVALYLEAYEAAPTGSILYNVARIYDLKLGDRPLAISFYRRFIADPGAHSELIVDANQRLRQLRDAELTASRSMEKSPVLGDGGRTPRELGASAGPGPGQEQRGGWSRSRWVGVALGGLGVVGIAVGGGFGLAAMSKADRANELCQGNACASQAGVDAAHLGRRDATLSNIGFLAGGALLITGGALFFRGGEQRPRSTSHAGLRLGTRATPSELSLQLSGRW